MVIIVKIYNKLVRDKIPEIMIKNGATPITHILDDKDYYLELKKKLTEEVQEFLESDDILEIADIEEVLLAIIKSKKISLKDFNKIRLEKKNKKGSFIKRIFLEKEE